MTPAILDPQTRLVSVTRSLITKRGKHHTINPVRFWFRNIRSCEAARLADMLKWNLELEAGVVNGSPWELDRVLDVHYIEMEMA